MPYQAFWRQSRICVAEGGHGLGQGVVLSVFIGQRIEPFEFHAD